MKLKLLSLAIILFTVIGNFISCTQKQSDVVPIPTTLNLSSSSLSSIANLGRVLFYDTHLSVNNSISCASCHKQAHSFADNVAVSPGFQNFTGKRNAITLQDLTNSSVLFWDGRDSTLSDMVLMPMLNHVEMGMNDINAVVNRVISTTYYADLFNKAFGSSTITASKIGSGLSAFLEQITTSNTPFDQSMFGSKPLSNLERYGENLFFNTYNCGSCHAVGVSIGYNNINTTSFLNIGLDANYSDNGLGALTGKVSDNGKFKVPNLRNVALTAPYMHDGRFATLNDVLEHYSHGIAAHPNLDERLKTPEGLPKRMNISDSDKAALIAFLNTLTDYSAVSNPDLASPFK